MNRTEELRRRYRPAVISVLFIGESAPAGGTFFYDDERPSKLRGITEAVMREELGARVGPDFLTSFATLGCYLDDLCLQPVNHLLKRDRAAACRACEPELAKRLRAADPMALVAIGVTRRRHFEAARRLAGIDAPLEVMPFPSRPNHERDYKAKLAGLLHSFDRRGFLLD